MSIDKATENQEPAQPFGLGLSEGLGAFCQSEIVMHAFIEVTTKPRLMKSGGAWICVGLVRPEWWRFWAAPRVVTWHGGSPWKAWHGWAFDARRSA